MVSYGGVIEAVGSIDATAFHLLTPLAAGALLTQAVLGLHFGLVFSTTLTIILIIYLPSTPLFAVYGFVTSIVACLSLSRFRSRSAYLRAGLNVSLFAIALAVCIALANDEQDFRNMLTMVACAAINGILSSVLASGVTPVVEHLGGYTTDMRLIEMATLDHPLLKELSVQAPGTWNHSMVMGMMAEGAAEAIGANPVVARVGAYFHDVGKIKKPLYFVENQQGQINRHDKLSPSMSALIIRSHVKDGIELAKKHRLPSVIEDLIAQHHGTNLVEYFYDKAVREAREQNEEAEVDPTPYLYPGPKPQTREAGIMMLADGIEAAARTIEDPEVDRIQGMVQKIINKVFSSGQLEDSQLTLRDLHLIAKAFIRILAGIHHHRIAYSEPAEKGGEGERATEETPRDMIEGQASQATDHRDTSENLKRLGCDNEPV
jgi:hypothetical protein